MELLKKSKFGPIRVISMVILLIFSSLDISATEAKPTVTAPTVKSELIQKLEVKEILVGAAKVSAEMAKDPGQQQKGLMYRKQMPADHGMLFIFDNEEVRNFWMKNTFIPLSIGFFNTKKELIDIQDMTPVVSEMQTDIPSYQSTGPAKYALEVNLGWFKKNKVRLGNKLNLN